MNILNIINKFTFDKSWILNISHSMKCKEMAHTKYARLNTYTRIYIHNNTVTVYIL